MRNSVAVTAGRWLAVATLGVLLAACQSRPEIRTQTAPDFEVGKYQTYGFVEHPSTDTAGYTTLTTRYLKDSVTRELETRGYTQSDNPELLVNFRVGSKDKVEGRTGPTVGVGYGRGWWHRGWGGWGGIGIGDRDIRTVTEGALSVDLVDKRSNALVWSGTASGTVTKEARDKPQMAIEQAVQQIFAKYPKPATVAAVTK
jgi:hypothetical protein